MDFTVSVSTAARTAALSKALAAYNVSAAQPLSQEDFLQKLIDGQLDGLVTAYLKTVLTKLEFLDRLTSTERIGIRTAAQSNAAIADYLAMLDAAQDVTLTDLRTIAGVQLMETGGLIAVGRAAQILAL